MTFYQQWIGLSGKVYVLFKQVVKGQGLGVQPLSFVYGKNSVGRGGLTLCAPQVPW
jgi:hypothetical protein